MDRWRNVRLFVAIIGVVVVFFSCCKEKPLVPQPPVVPPVEEVLTDTSIIQIAKGFEELLIKEGIINDSVNDGKALYSSVKNVDTIVIRTEDLRHFRFTCISGIKYFSKLVYLDIQGSYVDSLDLTLNTKLRYVDCGGLSIPGYGTHQTVKYLNVSQCPDLEYLKCNLNLLKELNVSSNSELKYLNFQQNDVASIDVSKNIDLEYLNSSYNRKIRKLDLTNNTKLEYLFCAANFVATLNVSHLSKLLELDCSGTYHDQIETFKSLDVSSNKALKYLSVSATNLDHIDLSGNVNLTELDISAMPFMKEIDVSKLVNLTDLDIRRGKFATINLASNKALEFLAIIGTALKTIDLQHNSELKKFVCYQQDSLTTLDLRPCPKLELCYTFQCANLKTICVAKLPARENIDWKTDDFAQYSLCH